MPVRRISAVALDLDGTLVRSFKTSHRLLVDGSSGFAVRPPSTGETRQLIMKLGLREIAKRLVSRGSKADEKTVDAFVQWVHRNHADYNRRHTQLVPGVDHCLETLIGLGCSVSVVSNNDRQNVLNVLTRFDLRRYFSTTVTADDVTNMKPHPEMVVKSAKEMHVRPSEMLVVGDSPGDGRAALLAGSPFCGVLTGVSEEQRLRKTGAELVLPSVCDVVGAISGVL
jgi:HAD superfamily hydrolase (TIGR01509 family)